MISESTLIVSIVGAVFASTGFWAFLTYLIQRKDDYENLHDYLYLPYKKLGGNGTAEKIMKEVERLPLKDREEEQNE